MYSFSPSMKSMAVGLISMATVLDGFVNAQGHAYYDRSNPYKPDPYKSDPYTSDPYTSDPYTSDPYTSDSYTSDSYTSDPYPTNTYTSDPYSGNHCSPGPYVSEPYRSKPYRPDPYAPDPYNPDPYPSDPYAPDPYTSDPYVSDPYPSDPYNPDPYSTDLYHSNQYSTDPYATDSYHTGPYHTDPYPTDPNPTDPYPTDPYPTVIYPSGGGNGTYGNGTPPDNSSYTPVIGVPDKVVERRPVSVLEQEYPDIFNMFILAMEALHDRPESEDESFFQIGGIHGWPYVTWQYPNSAIVNPDSEYCTHRSVLFSTWHRPYLALLEQTLHEEALRIANEFTGSDRERYAAAADDLRLPYWDWASEREIPSVVRAQNIDVVKPSGPTTIENPLYSYMFQQTPPGQPGAGETTRRADANEVIASSFSSRQADTLQLFSINQFNAFNSRLEGIHGGVHVDIGLSMASIEFSAFDPIFWLHHCNVDRIFAMYQATHPGQAVTPGSSGLPTLQLPSNAPADLSTPLYPFRDANGDEWTSDAIKDLADMYKFGYSYPETPADLSGAAQSTFTTQRIRELYAPDTNGPSFAEDSAGDSQALTVAQRPNARTEWGCNFIYDKEELPGSYRINVYLNGGSGNGPINGSIPESGSVDNLVGVAPIFSKVSTTNGSGIMNYTVALTPALIEKNIRLRPEETIPNLRERLYWTLERVDTPEITNVPITDLTTLKVSVVSKVTDYKDSDTELPEETQELKYVAPVQGKPGAVSADEASGEAEKAPAAIDEDLVTPEAMRKFKRSLVGPSAKMRLAKA